MKTEKLLEIIELLKDETPVKSDDTDSIKKVFPIGRKIFVRLVTYHLVGRVKSITGKFVILENASWIANTPRFSKFLKNGEQDEVEPTGDWFFNIESVVDGGEWKHDLPMEAK